MAKMKKNVTMADIAGKTGVSIVTVSKALSGQKGVSDQVRERIITLAQEMGYQVPHSAEREKKISRRIGVLVPDSIQGTYDSFYWRMYQAVADSAMRRDCFTGYEGLSRETAEKKLLPRLITDQAADGLIVIGKPENRYAEFLKRNAGVPLAFLDFYEAAGEADCFISDGFYGTYLLTDYLLERGHREIAYVGTLYATQSITDRYLGYLKSLMEHGITPPPDYLIPDRAKEGAISGNFTEYDLPERMPTAFVCNCDLTANLLIQYLERKGFRVPEDVSVVGFDNYPGTPYHRTDLTTYAADIPAMAERAVESLIRQMKGENMEKGIHIVEGYLVEGGSVRELRSTDNRQLSGQERTGL